MEISMTLVWLIAGLALGGTEILVGTFYLLVLGCACFAGALCSWIGLSFAWQCTVSAAVALLGGLWVHHIRLQDDGDVSQKVQNPDVGQSVEVIRANADGTMLVRYRGAEWTAVVEPGTAAGAAQYVISRVDGSRLVIRAA